MSLVRSDKERERNWSPWLLAATVVALLLIWGQSLLPVSSSSSESGWVLNIIVNPVLRIFGLGEMGHGLLRKLAHVTEFALLGFWLILLLRGKCLIALMIGFLAAALDESIQLFSDRSAEVQDIWIDFAGVVLGSLLGTLLWRLTHRQKPEDAQQKRK
ncbi:MAG: VanZ family protein [Oscillospiraceae bacterium]|nr:VanZ family protein [Oscillospiraceae bacterium]